MPIKINKNIQDKGIVYILQIDLEDRQLVKIGTTSRKIEERVVEILTSIWKYYRIFPKTYVARFKALDSPLDKEAQLLKYFSNYSYLTEHKFSGCTEIFDIDVEAAKRAYDEMVEGKCFHGLTYSKEQCTAT